MYIYILLAMVFFAVAVAPQVLALWYCNWVSKMEAMMEAMAEEFVTDMLSELDKILLSRLVNKVDKFAKEGFATSAVVGIGQNDIDYYSEIDNYTFADEKEISDYDFYAESLNDEIENAAWNGPCDKEGMQRHNGNIKCGIQLYHDGGCVSRNKGTWARSHGFRGNKPKTHK